MYGNKAKPSKSGCEKPEDSPEVTCGVKYYTYPEHPNPWNDLTVNVSPDSPVEKAKEGAEACVPPDVPGNRLNNKLSKKCYSKVTCEWGTETAKPDLPKPFHTNYVVYWDYWKTAATDGKTGHIGGTNTVDHHTNGSFKTGIRCDTYTCTEGLVADTS